MENAALERVQRRVQNTILEDTRQQLQNHLEETKQHQDRLRQLITKLGGTPTQEKGQLPLAMPPNSISHPIQKKLFFAIEIIPTLPIVTAKRITGIRNKINPII